MIGPLSPLFTREPSEEGGSSHPGLAGRPTLLDGGMFFPFAQLDGVVVLGVGGGYRSVTKLNTAVRWVERQGGVPTKAGEMGFVS